MALPLPFAVPAIPSLEAVRSPIAEVIRAAQQGSAEAFAQLYDEHASRVFAVCVGLAADRVAATELLQDTFVRAWERLSTYRGDAAFATWLHRIAVNEFLRQERARRRRTMRVIPDGDHAVSREDVLESMVAAESAGDPALSVDLAQAIARLPDGARRVFVLHDIAGYQHAEIASQLGIAEGTCKAHLFRARRLLRGMLDR